MIKHIIITGKVQGVGFRYFTRKNAERLNLNGWVKNLENGQVEAVFDGNKDHVEQMIELCKKGPASSNVEDVEIIKISGEGNFKNFEVLK